MDSSLLTISLLINKVICMNEILNIFKNPVIDLDRLNKMDAISDPESRYIIAITPRSGSTYLCDMLRHTKHLGVPGEMLGPASVVGNLKKMPGRTADEYIRNAIRVRKTPNGVSGLTVSWFQFQNFMEAMDDHSYLADFKYIYLTRRDLYAQAVSLYKATSSKVFHSNIQHNEETIRKFEALEYDYAKIKYWYDHLVRQEKGWQQYFYENRIFPLYITYEDIDEDIQAVLQRIAAYVKVKPENLVVPKRSLYEKVADNRNAEWARRFAWEHSFQETDRVSAPLSNGLVYKRNYQMRLRNLCQKVKNFW